jgi:hypothetical protein
MQIKIFLIAALSFVFMTGCQTPGYIITQTLLPVKQSRIAIIAAIGEARVVSQNGREITSYYHDKKLKYLDVTPKTKRRYYTKATILGARRPYDISIEVHVEVRDRETKTFQDIGLDENLSRLQARAVQKVLNQSLEKAQVIDDGAPF